MTLALFHLLVYLGDRSVFTWIVPLPCFPYPHGVVRHRQQICLTTPHGWTQVISNLAITNKDAVNTRYIQGHMYTHFIYSINA